MEVVVMVVMSSFWFFPTPVWAIVIGPYGHYDLPFILFSFVISPNGFATRELGLICPFCHLSTMYKS